ncbi:nucleotidyltransferase family protein [Flavobacterium sp. GB2R13]|uniref:nucleotidyltransferase family protein n=1 Tax=Flavobacterium algoris TaxID=3398733 RepID=UPI003A893B36
MEKAFGIIILAAGNSSRLGKPKQLLQYNGNTLLRETLLQANLLHNTFVLVVTGAYKVVIEKNLDLLEVQVVHNPNWEMGMASSISVGLDRLCMLKPNLNFCIFAVCDQPYVTAGVFEDLIEQHNKTGKGIVASEYADTLGTPVLFSSRYFNELLNLKGNEGAKKMLQYYKEDVASVIFEKGAIDIDTLDDYNNLINQIS